jgi:Cof subfamily protein (haloacid dehalogenase superfamily)
MERNINLNQFKLVISDIDGTLMSSRQPLHPFTKQVLKEIREHGLLFTLASGRNLPSAKAIAEELAIDLPMVLANGCIVQALDGNVLHRALMPVEITKRVIYITDEHGNDLVLFVDDRLYFKKMTGNIEPIFGHIPEAYCEVGDWANFADRFPTINKCMILERKLPEKLVALEQIFKDELTGKAEFYKTSLHHLEIMPSGVSKASGLKKLVEHLGIQMEEVMAFGDYDNDADMLSAAGLGIAVENATENVKNNADMIIGLCADNAPAQFLKELLGKMG